MKRLALGMIMTFLIVNLGALYYLVLWGGIPKLAKRLDLAETRINSFLAGGDELSVPEVKVGENVVILSDQQKAELTTSFGKELEVKLAELVAAELNAAGNGGAGEWFVPLGEASVQTSDNTWKDVPLVVDIDKANYPEGVTIYFEGTLKVPSGNGQVEARLVDMQAGEIAGSELVATGAEGMYKKSQAIELEEGRRGLKVQMRTSMDTQGELTNARLHLAVEEKQAEGN